MAIFLYIFLTKSPRQTPWAPSGSMAGTLKHSLLCHPALCSPKDLDLEKGRRTDSQFLAGEHM